MVAPAAPRPELPRLTELDVAIETPRLRLRPLAASDVEALWPFVSDPAFPCHMSWAAHASREETAAWIASKVAARASGEDLSWAIEHAGTAIGTIGIQISWQLRAWRLDRAEVGYWLGTPHWNQGFATEATVAVMRFAFETLGLHKLTIGCVAENTGSRRVIEKTGFRFVGRLEDDVWRDGQWYAHLRYELCAHEWSDVHTTLRLTRP